MIAAILLAAACVCPATPAPRLYDCSYVEAALREASRKTAAERAAKRERALEKLQKELDAVMSRDSILREDW